MREAVVRVGVDPGQALTVEDITARIDRLADRGAVVHRRPADRELELILGADDADDARQRTVELCTTVFGSAPVIGTITFISRGTDEDALGVVAAFGVRARMERTEEGGEEVAVFTLPTADRRRVPESRLHTALEAALNCEVRIVFA
jgi:hypothetical protein